MPALESLPDTTNESASTASSSSSNSSRRSTSSTVRSLAILGITATILVTTTRAEAHWMPWIVWTQTAILIAIALASRYLIGGLQQASSDDDRSKSKAYVSIVLVGAFMLGSLWLTEVLSRSFLDCGEAFETLAIASLQQLALLASLFAVGTRPRQIVFGLNLALVVFVSATAISSHAIWFSSAFLLAGGWWLFTEHWQRIRPALTSSEERPIWRVHVGLLSLVLLIVVACASMGPRTTWTSLQGFLPTSGGDSDSDPFARSGVGDGDRLVGATENANSFGPVESDIFLESQLPTLYDAFNDLYGEPEFKPKKIERTIGVDPDDFRQNHQQLPQSSQAREGLSTKRSKSKEKGSSPPRLGAEILQLIGTAPLHLAVDRFDLFDGESWHKRDKRISSRRIAMRTVLNKPWIFEPRRFDSWEVTGRTHQIRFVNFGSPILPAPPQLNGWHIDKIDRPDFFQWTPEDEIKFAGREKIPAMTIAHLISGGYRPAKMSGQWRPPRETVSVINPLESQTEESVHESQWVESQIISLSRSWNLDASKGLEEIEAIVAAMREEFQLEAKTVNAGDDSKDETAETRQPTTTDLRQFLETRRGSDLLFATTTALVLRARGYQTRLVAGYYATPVAYDRRDGVTKVRLRDAHTWVEVCLDGRNWILVEPTPGYRNTAEVWTIGDRLRALVISFGNHLKRFWPQWLFAVALLLSIWSERKWIADQWARLMFVGRVNLGMTVHGGHLTNLAETRFSTLGYQRPSSVSLERYLQDELGHRLPPEFDVQSFVTAVSAYHYQNSKERPSPAHQPAISIGKWLVRQSRRSLRVRDNRSGGSGSATTDSVTA